MSEATQASWADLDVPRRRLLVRSAKGGHPALRNVSRRLLGTLVSFGRNQAETARSNQSPLFPSAERRALSPRGAQYRFAFWLSRSGIRRRLSVHSLRHTFATLLYGESGDLLLVNRALGHRDVRATQRYVHVDDRQLIRALNRLRLGPKPL